MNTTETTVDTTVTPPLDPPNDAIWILTSTFIIFTMQSGECTHLKAHSHDVIASVTTSVFS